MQEHFQILSRYNAWANHRLYAVAGRLSARSLSQARPAAFFTSIVGTLNHILVGDRIWLDRIERRRAEVPKLDALPYPRFADLKEARSEEDRRIMGLIDRLRPQDYLHKLSYRNTKDEPHETLLPQVLTHLFNHQTHHRGQIHCLLTQSDITPPPLDVLEYLMGE